ncbi:MAG: glycosyl hydrolase family protein [Sphingobacteriales bacterium]|nr:MAG: glycosyl hydrolase family protein [Sphingobacteriales bacterium]
MKKLNFILILSLLLSLVYSGYCQSGWLPPVYFPPGKLLCDTTPWKLVLLDNFNGDSINRDLWYTFNTNNWGDHDDWAESRIEVYGGNKTIVKDENVQVSDGTVKLKMKQETTSWKCNSCPGTPQTRNYTSGYIGSKMRFNNGAKVETRLRMPIFEDAWNTCWFWALNDVNEIDFAESWSNNGMPSWPYIGKHKPHNNYNLHSWRPRWDTNGYFPKDIDISNRYPNQDWSDWIGHTRFRYEDWHKYTCEWDTASVTIYLDDVLINKFWKYYRDVQVQVYDPYTGAKISRKMREAATCTLPPGDWQITKGYPWNSENSVSKLIFSVAATKTNKLHNTSGPVDLGAMEIDYVRMYQRHPEEDGHTELSYDTAGALIINGPGNLCGSTIYSISNTYAGGTWSSSNNAVVFVDAPEENSKRVERNPNSSLTTTTLYYTFNPGGDLNASPVTAAKLITVGQVPERIFTTRVSNLFTGQQNFNLWVNPNPTGTSYSWKIWYGRSGPEHYFESEGQHVTTPAIDHDGLGLYFLKWELLLTKPCGPKVISGSKENTSGEGPYLSDAASFMSGDSLTFNLEARFETEMQWKAYRQSIEDNLSTAFITDIGDTFAITQLLNKISVQQLEPWLFFEDSAAATLATQLTLTGNPALHAKMYAGIPLYPAPVKLSDKFKLRLPALATLLRSAAFIPAEMKPEREQ